MLQVFLPATFCVLTRALLCVCDRQVFKQEDVDLFKSLVLNAVLPFLVAIGFAWALGQEEADLWEHLFHPGIILGALGSQLAACVFALSFARMPVKNVAASSKIVDFFIPLLLAWITSRFVLSDYIFSSLSALIFTPLLVPRERSSTTRIQFGMVLAIVVTLTFQAGINGYFGMDRLASSLSGFLTLMSCIFFWRAVFILAPYIVNSGWKASKQETGKIKVVSYTLLFFRSIVSFLSQAAFFYSITRASGHLAWPILNATPLFACLSAHIILKEKMGTLEMGVLAALTILTISYLWYTMT